MRAGPPKKPSHPLQRGDLVLKGSMLRRGHVTEVQKRQRPGSLADHRNRSVALKEDLLERGSGSFFLEQGPEATQIGYRPCYGETFSTGAGLPPQRSEHFMGLLPLIPVTIDLRVEAPPYSSACRVILRLHRQPQGSPQPGPIPNRF